MCQFITKLSVLLTLAVTPLGWAQWTSGEATPVISLPIKGSVLHRAESGIVPAAGATVYFHPAQQLGGQYPIVPKGEVGTDGTFAVDPTSVPQGMPAGEYKVLITWGQGAEGDRLGLRYASTIAPRFVVTVDENGGLSQGAFIVS